MFVLKLLKIFTIAGDVIGYHQCYWHSLGYWYILLTLLNTIKHYYTLLNTIGGATTSVTGIVYVIDIFY